MEKKQKERHLRSEALQAANNYYEFCLKTEREFHPGDRIPYAGNLIKHPCFDQMRASGEGLHALGELTVTDRIMFDTFWVGVYPGMTGPMLAYLVEIIAAFTKGRK